MESEKIKSAQSSDKKNWIKPDVEIISVESGNTPFGAEGHNTTMFSGNLSQVVFSPYWNVPPSIVKKEILPGIARNKNYLEEIIVLFMNE